MRSWSRLRSWLRAALRRSRMERDMDAELRLHIEAFAEDLVHSGVPREEAWRRARIEFGGLERAKEECRDALALGIGADTAMYSIVNGALSWDFGLENRDRIVMVNSVDRGRSQEWGASY